jgi:hypothetical protein
MAVVGVRSSWLMSANSWRRRASRSRSVCSAPCSSAVRALQLGGARLHLLLQPLACLALGGAVLGELGGHRVDAASHGREFVATLFWNAVIEVAALQRERARAQPLQRQAQRAGEVGRQQQRAEGER